MLGSQANLLESLINLSVSVIILLFSVKSKLLSPYKRVLRVKGAMYPIAFWSVTLDLLYRGQTSKKLNSFSFHIWLISIFSLCQTKKVNNRGNIVCIDTIELHCALSVIVLHIISMHCQ